MKCETLKYFVLEQKIKALECPKFDVIQFGPNDMTELTLAEWIKYSRIRMITFIKGKLKKSDSHTNIEKYRVTAFQKSQNLISAQKSHYLFIKKLIRAYFCRFENSIFCLLHI